MNPRQAAAALFVLVGTCMAQPTPHAVRASGSQDSIFNVRDFGAKGDGVSLDTLAIARAIQAAASAGGGRLLIPRGIYVVGTLELKSNITLQLEAGAVLKGSGKLQDYGLSAAFGFGRDYGLNSTGEGSHVGMLVGLNLENVAIIGSGAIDGNADVFFDFKKPHYSMDFDPKYTRQGESFMSAERKTGDGPVDMASDRPGTMIVCVKCSNVVIRDVTLRIRLTGLFTFRMGMTSL